MTRILFIISLVAFTSSLFGQERYFDERYISSLSMLNPVLINPGATGANDTHQVIANYKNEWATFPDSPKSFMISYDGPVADKLGFGAQFISDRNGSLNTSKVQGSLSYRIESLKNKLTVGLAGEYIKHGLEAGAATNALTQGGDPNILARLDGSSFFDVTVGVFGVYDAKITYGLTLPALVNSRLSDNPLDDGSRDFGYVINAGYIYASSTVDAVFEPSIFVKKFNEIPMHVDINLLGRFADDKFRGGVTYTVGAHERVGFIIGTTFNSLELNYSYNISRNDFQTYNNGSHEISLRFDIGKSNTAVEAVDMGTMPVKAMPEGINN